MQERSTFIIWAATTAGVALTTLCLDLLWLGVFAKKIYDNAMGVLKADPIRPLPAILFYAMYAFFILWWPVRTSATALEALFLGAAMGFLAYGTYEFTNWAVIRNWPALLVGVDLAWGVALTSVSAFVGKSIQLYFSGR